MFESDLYDGAQGMLKSLYEAGCKMAIASSKPGKYVAAILEKLGIDEYFSFISAPEIGHVNPTKQELIDAAVSALGADKAKTVMVGDRLFDIEGAKLSGVASIGAVYGFGGEEEMKKHGADMLAYSTSEITELILE